MAAPLPADPVKLVVFLLWADASARDAALRRLVLLWGATDYAGADHAFVATRYYEREMGSGLHKRVLSFERLVSSELLSELKRGAIDCETALARGGDRRVNIDPGYLDVHKLVLASVKPAWQKLHVGGGVYADLTLRYSKGAFHALPWTFPDYASGEFDRDLLAVRAIYKAQLSLQNPAR